MQEKGSSGSRTELADRRACRSGHALQLKEEGRVGVWKKYEKCGAAEVQGVMPLRTVTIVSRRVCPQHAAVER